MRSQTSTVLNNTMCQIVLYLGTAKTAHFWISAASCDTAVSRMVVHVPWVFYVNSSMTMMHIVAARDVCYYRCYVEWLYLCWVCLLCNAIAFVVRFATSFHLQRLTNTMH